MHSIVIVGASLAGYRAAQALRREGFDGTITLVGEDARRPYDRPPLSKQILAGTAELESIALERVGDELGIEWRLGERAVSFDSAQLVLGLAGGEELSADGFVLACGARPRPLPRSEGIGGVHLLRTVEDSLALREALLSGGEPRRLVVVGAGFIGAEVAATARGLGCDVTVVEALDRPLARVLPPVLGQVCADLHVDHGVDLRLGVGVDGFDTADGSVSAIRLSDGSTIDADLVAVGIGVIPNTEWLEGSGLTIDDGIVCDETTLAAPGVVAAGDVARWPNPLFGETMRVEHWDNAVSMGQHAARRLLAGDDGRDLVYAPVPYFWSDQYDRKIQLVGRARPDDEVAVVDGSIDERRFVALLGRDGRLVGAFGMNRPPAVQRWRLPLEESMSWDEALRLAD